MRRPLKSLPPFVRDALIFFVIFAAAIGVAHALSRVYDDNNPFATSLFILVVAVISRYTNGYLPGIIASVVGVLCVNCLFTYPFGEFDMSISGYPMTFAVMLLVSVFISTLTTQIKKQEQLRYEAEKDKMRANLLRSVSHDIRTPLTAIIGSSSVLSEQNTLAPEERAELARGINRNAIWLLRMTENILSVTRFSSDGVVLEKTDEVVEEIVGSAIMRFRKTTGNSISITVSAPEDIVLAPMDAMLIEQVLLNLLENVVQHAKTATAIQIQIEQHPDKVQISVADNGEGLPKHLLPVLFDGYEAMVGENSDRNRRMGIGLTVCRAIIRAHGGEISAENAPSGGAIFHFWLPTGGVTA